MCFIINTPKFLFYFDFHLLTLSDTTTRVILFSRTFKRYIRSPSPSLAISLIRALRTCERERKHTV